MNKSAILVINCGSSSLKFSLLNPVTGEEYLAGIAECLNSEEARVKYRVRNESNSEELAPPYNHQLAMENIVSFIKVHDLADYIIAIGHRVVHGGESFSEPTLINKDVIQVIENLSKMAPLHNPANLVGITATQQVYSHLPQVAIFDTAFHQSMPEKAYLYGLPYSLYKSQGIRKYGFHGTSHYFVCQKAANILNIPVQKLSFISAHLGNGCSITAVKNGKSVDSSMGFTPLEGVLMGTRSGSVDPGIILYLIRNLHYSAEKIDLLMNKQSGLLGLSELSNDCRALEKAMNEGNEKAQLALEVFCYQIAKSISCLSASLQQLDGLIFTGGIGENSAYVRSKVLSQLTLLNFAIDQDKNKKIPVCFSGCIHQKNSRNCFVIPTNEEWVIAEQTLQLLNQKA